MLTKVYKIELMVIDTDSVGEADIRAMIEQAHYANHCIAPTVQSVTHKLIDYTDEHPLNNRHTCKAEFCRLFS